MKKRIKFSFKKNCSNGLSGLQLRDNPTPAISGTPRRKQGENHPHRGGNAAAQLMDGKSLIIAICEDPEGQHQPQEDEGSL